jgi:hypothetical protein
LKRGRRSKSEDEILTSGRMPGGSITPPASLGEAEAKLFREIVGLCPPSHFVQSDAPLLASYAAATVLARRAGKMLERDAAFRHGLGEGCARAGIIGDAASPIAASET